VDAGDLVDALHSRGQRATPQRSVILRELRRRGRHVTADEIRRSIHHELPGTSTPTLYATLDLLVELGMARRIDTGRGAALYDARTEPHQHLVCRRCGRVQDLDQALDTTEWMRGAQAAGFHADGAELVISGLCAGCAAPESPVTDARRPASARSGARR
jgi:Fe2+ or Zn2+ uptake regulation protein